METGQKVKHSILPFKMFSAQYCSEAKEDTCSYSKSTTFKMALQQNFTAFIYNTSHILGS